MIEKWQMLVGVRGTITREIWHIAKPDGNIYSSLCGREETASFPVPFSAMGTTPLCAKCVSIAIANHEREEHESQSTTA